MEGILVIDDDVEMCGMLAEYLQAEWLQVETIHNARTVLNEHCQGNTLFFCSISCTPRSVGMLVGCVRGVRAPF
jgi:DNA-binding NtrC family response regulator